MAHRQPGRGRAGLGARPQSDSPRREAGQHPDRCSGQVDQRPTRSCVPDRLRNQHAGSDQSPDLDRSVRRFAGLHLPRADRGSGCAGRRRPVFARVHNLRNADRRTTLRRRCRDRSDQCATEHATAADIGSAAGVALGRGPGASQSTGEIARAALPDVLRLRGRSGQGARPRSGDGVRHQRPAGHDLIRRRCTAGRSDAHRGHRPGAHGSGADADGHDRAGPATARGSPAPASPVPASACPVPAPGRPVPATGGPVPATGRPVPATGQATARPRRCRRHRRPG